MRQAIIALMLGSIANLPAFVAAESVMTPIDLRHVQVDGEIGRRIEVTVENNLLVVDLDGDFLDPFRKRTAKDGYVGLGKTIDALSRFAAYTDDPRVKEKRDHVVNEIIALQEPDGYIGFFQPEARLWSLWDIHETAYLIYGLLTEYELFGNEAALEAARKAADYVMRGWQAAPEKLPGGGEITVYMAVTAIEPALLRLYNIVGDERCRAFCTDFRRLPEWDGEIVTGRWGSIQGHVYAYLSRVLGQLALYDIAPDEGLLGPSRKALDFMLRDGGLTIIGAVGQHECWHDTQDGAANLGETCATAYAIRWWDALLRREGKARYGDLIERALYNALFAAQSPDGRHLRYYVPFEGPRVYFDKDTYCCPCNYRRIVSELPQLIYYAAPDGVVVNLYAPSQATVPLDDETTVSLRQETDYPSDGKVLMNIDPSRPSRFALRLRKPHWGPAPRLTVNGEAYDATVNADGFIEVLREWQAGDRIELDMPMTLRLVKGQRAQAGRAAVMCGPQVFTLNREHNPALAEEDLRLITIDPQTLQGPFPDDSVRPGGLSCKIKAWRTTSWYPFSKHDWELTLTEYPDPKGEMIYFHAPNPKDPALLEDSLQPQIP